MQLLHILSMKGSTSLFSYVLAPKKAQVTKYIEVTLTHCSSETTQSNELKICI
jgi:hypothetical protein